MNTILITVAGITLAPFVIYGLFKALPTSNVFSRPSADLDEFKGSRYRGMTFSQTMGEIAIFLKKPIPHRLTLAPKGQNSDTQPIIETGDYELDFQYDLKADSQLAAGLLSSEARQVICKYHSPYILQIWPKSIVVTILQNSVGNDWSQQSNVGLSFSSGDVPVHVPGLVKLAEELTRESTLKELLMQNVRKDPSPEVRIHQLQLLINKGYGDLQPLIVEASQMPMVPVRIFAARHLGKDGLKIMDGLIREQPKYSESICKVLKEWPASGGIERLEHLLNRHEFAKDAVVCLAEEGREDLVPRILNLMNEASFDWQVKLTDALGVIQSTKVSDYLVEQLSNPIEGVFEASLDALGRCGDKNAVLPLMGLAKEGPKKWRKKAKLRIAEIQARLGPVERGWLSFDANEELQGALSEPEKGKGGLSLSGGGRNSE